ncbi:MAG: DUF6785 family protein [Candidatus Poribacteria bacterium]
MRQKGVTWRSVLIGLLLIPINTFWIARSETGSTIFYSTTSSLFCNAVFTLFILTLLNAGTRLWLKSGFLDQRELLTVYVMVSSASALSGESVGQQLVRDISAPFWYATPENEWSALFFRYLPKWLTVDNKHVLKGFYEASLGESSLLYTSLHIKTWLIALLPWLALILLIVFIMMCINAIVRKQWIEHEKLTYPVIQLPLAMTSTSDNLLKNKRMWIGFGIGAGITLLNGFHTLIPSVPGIRNIYNISDLFISKPWDSMQPMVIAFYPCAVGLAYFMPLDLAFSTWFFFFFWKAQLVIGSILGFHNMPDFPYAKWQQTGAYLAVGVLALWLGRSHIINVLKIAWKGKSAETADEPMSYRTALLGIILGFGLLIFFGLRIGLNLWVGILFFGIYLVLSIAIARMRAELGPLVHELYYSNSDQVITAFFGTRRITPNSLTIMSMFWWLSRSQNSHVMPHQLEAFKMAERTDTDTRSLWVVMLISAVLGAFFCSWAILDNGYRYGGNEGFASEAYGRLQSWLTNPRSMDVPASVFTGVGFIFSLLLMWMKRRFLWWQFHPIGYAVTQGDWAITFIWFPIFVSWLAKSCILKYGNIKMHRKAVPIFLGLILGDFIVGAIWGLFGLFTGMQVYHFKNW